MDSWFTMPATVVALAQHLKVIGMVKKSPRIHYAFNGQSLDLKAIYRRIRKRRGRAKILASADVMLKEKVAAKLVFVRDRRKKDWLALLSTDIQLSDAEIVRIYGKRWDIEVFFKMAKQHLKLAKEIPAGINGIKVTEYEYETLTGLAIDYLPYPTDSCDLCIAWHKERQSPACVKHCQARCMEFGHLADLAHKMASRPKMVLFAPR